MCVRSLILAMFTLAAHILFPVSHTQVPAEEGDEGVQMLEGVAAIVNDQVISFYDVSQRAQLILLSIGIPPTEETLQQASVQALEQLINEYVQLQKAAEFELFISDEEVDESIAGIAQQNGQSVEAFLGQLTINGIGAATFQQQIRAETAWRRLTSGLYGRNIRISDLQISARLDQLLANAEKTQYHVSELFIYAPEQEVKNEALTFAQSLYQQLLQGTPFQIAVQRFSSAPSAAAGGDLGWVAADELKPALQNALATLSDPGISQPTVAEDGIYILALHNQRNALDIGDVLDLRQISQGKADISILNSLSGARLNCDNLEDEIASDLALTNLGEIAEDGLNTTIRSILRGLDIGTASNVIKVGQGEAILVVCERKNKASEILPSRDQIENQLYSQQISMLSQRFLRDLKRDATIIRR